MQQHTFTPDQNQQPSPMIDPVIPPTSQENSMDTGVHIESTYKVSFFSRLKKLGLKQWFVGGLALLILIGGAGAAVVLMRGNLDSRNQASVTNGPVTISVAGASSNLPINQPATITLAINTSGVQTDGVQLKFKMLGKDQSGNPAAIFNQSTLTAVIPNSGGAGLEQVISSVEPIDTAGEKGVEITLFAIGSQNGSFSTTQTVPFYKIDFTPTQNGSVSLVFDQSNSIVTQSASVPPMDVLNTLQATTIAVGSGSNIPPTATAKEVKIAFVGDQGLGEYPRNVLTMLKNQGVDAISLGGDFGYKDLPTETGHETAPADWFAMHEIFYNNQGQLTVPILSSIGNHDENQWEDSQVGSGYKNYLKKFYTDYKAYEASNPSTALKLNCEFGNDNTNPNNMDQIGINQRCILENVNLVYSAIGELSSNTQTEYLTYIKDSIEAANTPWNICSWHRNNNLLQTGSKTGNIVGYDAYNLCRKYGAIIASYHEHAYGRTHTISNYSAGTPDFSNAMTVTSESLSNNGTLVRLTDHNTQGTNFAFFSGLGGQSIRGEDKAEGSSRWLTTYPWWAAYSVRQNASRNSAEYTELNNTASSLPNKKMLDTASPPWQGRTVSDGALICTFNYQNDPKKAFCEFINVDKANTANNLIVDRFTVISDVDGDLGTVAPPATTPTPTPTPVPTSTPTPTPTPLPSATPSPTPTPPPPTATPTPSPSPTPTTNTVPIAQVLQPSVRHATISAGTTVNFVGTGIDPETPSNQLSYKWQVWNRIGTNDFYTDQNFSRVFNSPDPSRYPTVRYGAKLVVTDPQGNSSVNSAGLVLDVVGHISSVASPSNSLISVRVNRKYQFIAADASKLNNERYEWVFSDQPNQVYVGQSIIRTFTKKGEYEAVLNTKNPDGIRAIKPDKLIIRVK